MVDHIPVEFSKALLKLEVDYMRYKDTVVNAFCDETIKCYIISTFL